MIRLVFLWLQLPWLLFSIQGQTSFPYLSGYTWAFFCNWRLLNEDYGSGKEDFDPEMVRAGDSIFLDFGRVEDFVRDYLPKISAPILLVTGNYGYCADQPMPGDFAYLLNDEKIAAWFVQNLDRPQTEKLFPIPIGIANKHWSHGNTDWFDLLVPHALSLGTKSLVPYLNFAYRPERASCIDYFHSIGAEFEGEKPFEAYLWDLANAAFVVSPPGNGLDCHRTWEALLMGSFPIVKRSTLDPLFEDLPVMIVDRWSEATPEFLREKHAELTAKPWSREKLYAPYWFEKVKAVQDRVRHSVAESIVKKPFLDGFPSPMYACDAEANAMGGLCKRLYEAYPADLARGEEYLIPKILHFIWLGSPLPEDCAKWIATWRRLHPGWTVRVWSDRDVAGFHLVNRQAFDKANNFGEKSDIFRYEILYRFGGVYIDTDFECLKPLDDLHKSCEFYTGTIGGDAETHYLLNGLIGAKPKHPVLRACIENLRIGNGDHDSARIMNDTGPYHFTRMAQEYFCEKDLGKALILPPLFFYPFNPPAQTTSDPGELKRLFAKPETIAIHYWRVSWQK